MGRATDQREDRGQEPRPDLRYEFDRTIGALDEAFRAKLPEVQVLDRHPSRRGSRRDATGMAVSNQDKRSPSRQPAYDSPETIIHEGLASRRSSSQMAATTARACSK